MYKIISAVLIILANSVFCQELPKLDYGFILTYNNSNRNIPLAPKQHAVNFPTLDYKFNINFKNKISFKTSISIFATGHTFSYLLTSDHGFSKPYMVAEQSIYVYIRTPIILSFNIKRFYIDLGAAPCIRIYNNTEHYAQSGSGISRPGGTYTLEGRLGYYIPLKYRRLFVETGVCFSEINAKIYLPGRYFQNKYSRNLQVSIGYLFNRVK